VREAWPALYEVGADVVRSNRSCGVLVLTLGATDYSREFVTGAGESFHDAGTARCTTP
jgi:hypothetical protein